MKLTALKTHEADRTPRRGAPYFESYDEPNESHAKKRIATGICEPFDAKKQAERARVRKADHADRIEALDDLHAQQRESLEKRQQVERQALTGAPEDKAETAAPETK